MIGSARAAADFIERIAGASEARAGKDYESLLARKRRDQPSAERSRLGLEALKERVRAEQLGFDSQSVRPILQARTRDGRNLRDDRAHVRDRVPPPLRRAGLALESARWR